ncbi:MAG: gamma-glutamylcyclotransferase [Ruminococcaceae bacterium]|jgi:gamma-glutamylcyclotransferase (GGCT)/AIG2-like uncharacterized protein YtfP|nr:gamma-glutamylcyclotransferase [Oscillospiraceae bacterium]
MAAKKRVYYIAYGSNLNVEQMSRRCPGARPLGTTLLQNWQLSFKGSKTGAYLTIDPAPRALVPAVVWEVTQSDIEALDHYEGYPVFYTKKEIEVTYRGIRTHRARTVTAFVYTMTEGRPVGIPTNSYVRTCAIGYDEFGFNKQFLWSALDRGYKEAMKDA